MLSPTTPCLPSALLGPGHRGVRDGRGRPALRLQPHPACTCRVPGCRSPLHLAPAAGLLCAFGPPAAKRALGHRTRGTELEKEATHLPEVSDIEEVEGVEQLAAPEPELIVADLEEGAYVLQTEKLGTRRKSRYRGPTGAAAAPATRRPVPARAPGQDARARTPRTAPAHPGRPWPRAPSPCSRLSTLDTHDLAWNEMCQPRVSEDGARTHTSAHTAPPPRLTPTAAHATKPTVGGCPTEAAEAARSPQKPGIPDNTPGFSSAWFPNLWAPSPRWAWQCNGVGAVGRAQGPWLAAPAEKPVTAFQGQQVRLTWPWGPPARPPDGTQGPGRGLAAEDWAPRAQHLAGLISRRGQGRASRTREP